MAKYGKFQLKKRPSAVVSKSPCASPETDSAEKIKLKEKFETVKDGLFIINYIFTIFR